MNIVVSALAAWQIIEIWHHSTLMASPRSTVETWTGFLGRLLVCPFCLSPWVSAICLLCLALPDITSKLGLGYRLASLVASGTIHVFAVARLANLGNDVFKQFCLTPKVTDFLESVGPLDESKVDNV
jgi:hypothetical protein